MPERMNDLDTYELVEVARNVYLAEQLIENGDYAMAEIELRAALRLMEDQFGSNDGSLVSILLNLGLICHALEKHEEAYSVLSRGLTLGERELGSEDPLVRSIQATLEELVMEYNPARLSGGFNLRGMRGLPS